MSGITGIKAACKELGLKASSVTMQYDNVLGEAVYEFVVDGETVEVRAIDGMTPEQIVSMALQAMLPEEPLPLPLMSAVQLEPVVFKEDAPQIENYDLVDDGTPMPKPALFFYDDPKKETP